MHMIGQDHPSMDFERLIDSGVFDRAAQSIDVGDEQRVIVTLYRLTVKK